MSTISKFITPENLGKNKPKVKANMDVVNDFINRFNKLISKGKLHANNAVGNKNEILPTLNQAELILATKQAKLNGWNLECRPDNYQTVSYYMSAINS